METTTQWTIQLEFSCSTRTGALPASSTSTKTGASPCPKFAVPSVERPSCQMIRHTTLLLLAFGLAAPVPVFADPPTSHVLSQSTATVASRDTLGSHRRRRRLE